MKIKLQFYEEEDATELHVAVHSSLNSLQPWLPWASPNYSLDSALDWIQFSSQQRTLGDHLIFGIFLCDEEEEEREGAERKKKGRFVGGADVRFNSPCASLGYWVREGEQGKGIATGAVRELVEIAFKRDDITSIEIIAAKENEKSRKVAERSGFTFTGMKSGLITLLSGPVEAAVYTLQRK